MTPRPIRAALFAATALLACPSCSKNDGRSGQASDTSSPPDVSATVTPGVAFNFAYEFTLPDDRISATQEAHAAACENLGLSKCRITGMSYSVDENEQVNAELDLKLDPLIARQFGKSARDVVSGNDGKLLRLVIGSSDEGPAIEQASNQKNDAAAEISQLQQELARTKPESDAHANILSRIQMLQQQSSEQSRKVAAGQAALASTPMEFHYYGRGGVPGFRGNPVREAWHTFVGTIVWLIGMVLQALAVIVPLALLAGLLILLWRTRPMRAVRRWLSNAGETET
ncbi:hypothetical protein ACUXST_001357 [Sphingomonas sp. F9_3S_D5_B_2]